MQEADASEARSREEELEVEIWREQQLSDKKMTEVVKMQW